MDIIKKNIHIRIFNDLTKLFNYAAEDFLQQAMTAIEKKGVFTVVLSGGHTPQFFFDTLSHYGKNTIPWDKIKFFFGDERYVPANDINSNYHMAYEHLFSKVSVDPSHIYRIPTELLDPDDAARAYEKTINENFSVKKNELPQFDLCYLGLGANAHTASLMPFNEVVNSYLKNSSDENQPFVEALFDTNSNLTRITLMPQIINNSKNIIFMVTGEDKATAVWDVLEGERNPIHFPAQLIDCVHGSTFWYLDQLAAKKLTLSTKKT